MRRTTRPGACVALATASLLVVLVSLLKGDGPGSGRTVLAFTPQTGVNSGDLPVLAVGAVLGAALVAAGRGRDGVRATGFAVTAVGIGGLTLLLALGTGPGSRSLAWAPGAEVGLSVADWPIWLVGAAGVFASGVGAADAVARPTLPS